MWFYVFCLQDKSFTQIYLKPKVTLQFLLLNISIPISIW